MGISKKHRISPKERKKGESRFNTDHIVYTDKEREEQRTAVRRSKKRTDQMLREARAKKPDNDILQL